MADKIDTPVQSQPVRQGMGVVLRSGVAVTAVSWTSAIAVAWWLRSGEFVPMLSPQTYAAGSLVALVAGVAALGLRRAALKVGRTGIHPRLVHVLFWITVCWGALALL